MEPPIKLTKKIKDYINKKFFFGRSDAILPTGDDLAGLYNPYYARLSAGFNLAALATSALLVLFILGAVLLNIGSITSENLYYFIKDFDAIVTSDAEALPTVIYSYEDSRTYTGYKGGFVTAGRSTLSVFSATGRKTKSYYSEYSNPVLRASYKYFLAYDAGGSRLSVYNSFARLRRLDFNHPILTAVICESGDFAVLTSDSTYNSVIYRYGSDFELDGKYQIANFVTSMSLDPSGKYLIVAYAEAGGDSLKSGIRIYDNRGSTPVFTKEVGGLILACGVSEPAAFSDNICYYYISEDLLAVGGTKTGETTISPGDDIKLFSYSGDSGRLAVTAADSEGYILYHLSGDQKSETIRLPGKPTAVKLAGGMAYVLCGTELMRYNLTAGMVDSLSLSSGAEDIIISESGYIFVCYPSGAQSVRF